MNESSLRAGALALFGLGIACAAQGQGLPEGEGAELVQGVCSRSRDPVEAPDGSMRFQSRAIPSGEVHAGIVRHMRPTRDGNRLIHQSSTNRVLLVTPRG